MLRARSFWVAAAAVLYAGIAAILARPGERTAWVPLALGLAVLVLGWRLAGPPRRGIDRADPIGRRAGQAVAAGTALTLACELAPGTPPFAVGRAIGVGLACVAALVALQRLPSPGGIAALGAPARYQAAIAGALPWLAAIGLALERAFAQRFAEAVWVDYAVVAAALASLSVGSLAAYRVYAVRRFELGVGERAAASLWLGCVCAALGVFAALLEVAPAERVVPLTALAAAVCTVASALAGKPERVARALRTSAALTLTLAPLVCGMVVLAFKHPAHGGVIVFGAIVAAGCLGLLTPALARRLAPERGRWLEVLDRALAAAKAPDPETAVIGALAAIREGLPRDAAQSALYRIASGDRLLCDRAGYLHAEPAELPPRLTALADHEPYRVVSTEALRSVQVRATEVRPLVAWLDARGAGAAALVHDEEVCAGALLWPAAGRTAPLGYEEVMALRLLADHLGAATGASAQLARARARELEAAQSVGEVERRLGELRGELDRHVARQRALAEKAARPARLARYSPAVQTTTIEIERLGALDLPVALVAAAGIDAPAWAAVLHLASPRCDGLFLVVEGTAPEEHALQRWAESERSPYTIARGGTLVVLDAQALPLDVQRWLGSAARSDTGLVLVVAPPREGETPIEERLADRVGDRWLRLPTLAERGEDLRALALDELSRIGIRLRGRPFGLSLLAQELLNENPWAGNEAELSAVLLRAALGCAGDVVTEEMLAAAMGAPARSDPKRVAR